MLTSAAHLPTSTVPMHDVPIHFVRNGPSYLPELDAYTAYLSTLGCASHIHDQSKTVPTDAQVVWWICGRVPLREAWRLRHAFQVHEYTSASVPPHAWLKDQVKHWTQPRPDYRIFQNGWVRERMGFGYEVPHALRDMGVAPHFFDIARPAVQATLPEPEFDLVYLGEMGRLLPFLPVLQSIHDAGRSVLLVGDVPDNVRTQLPPSVTCAGRVPHTQVPRQLRRARFGLNLVSNVEPYNQQTSTKLLEYCAAGLRVVSNDYAWVRYFATQHEGNFHLLHDEPNTWQHSFGEALDAYPYVVPDVSKLAWPEVLKALPIWSLLFGRTA
jgi:hypothetical protein